MAGLPKNFPEEGEETGTKNRVKREGRRGRERERERKRERKRKMRGRLGREGISCCCSNVEHPRGTGIWKRLDTMIFSLRWWSIGRSGA